MSDSVKLESEVLRAQDTKLILFLDIRSAGGEHLMHVKKICNKIAPLESKTIQILIQEEKLLENYFKVDISPKLIEAYVRHYDKLGSSKHRDFCEF